MRPALVRPVRGLRQRENAGAFLPQHGSRLLLFLQVSGVLRGLGDWSFCLPQTKRFGEINRRSDHSLRLHSVTGSEIGSNAQNPVCFFVILSSLWVCCCRKWYRPAEMLLAGRVPLEQCSGIGQQQELYNIIFSCLKEKHLC